MPTIYLNPELILNRSASKVQMRENGDVAQLGEHLLCTQGVVGSSPIISTKTSSGNPKQAARAMLFGNRIEEEDIRGKK